MDKIEFIEYKKLEDNVVTTFKTLRNHPQVAEIVVSLLEEADSKLDETTLAILMKSVFNAGKEIGKLELKEEIQKL